MSEKSAGDEHGIQSISNQPHTRARAKLAKQVRYDSAIAEEIVRRIAAGETLLQICRSSGYPTPPGWRSWIAKRPALRERYEIARVDGFDAIAEEAIAIADDQSRDPNDRRVAVDTRKWLLSKLRPAKYGDKSIVEHAGGMALAGSIEIVLVPALAGRRADETKTLEIDAGRGVTREPRCRLSD